MKAIKIEIIVEDNADAEFLITQELPKLKEKWKIKQVFWNNCEYFEK